MTNSRKTNISEVLAKTWGYQRGVSIDGTARPQLINKNANPSYYRILDKYRKLTGIPSIVNTSFNMHEEPIVCSPGDALRSFRDGSLDFLAIGNFFIEHPARGSVRRLMTGEAKLKMDSRVLS